MVHLAFIFGEEQGLFSRNQQCVVVCYLAVINASSG